MALDDKKNRLTLIIEDFKAILECRFNEEELKVRKFGFGTRNERGSTLINNLEERRLFTMNSFFNKKPQKKLRWVSPSGVIKNEITFYTKIHC